MNVNVQQREHFTILQASGRLDTDTARGFEQHCSAAIEEGARHVVLDLGAVDFVSSAGLRAILATAKRLRPMGGGLAVCRLAAGVQEVFKISGFARLMPVVADVEVAFAALREAESKLGDREREQLVRHYLDGGKMERARVVARPLVHRYTEEGRLDAAEALLQALGTAEG